MEFSAVVLHSLVSVKKKNAFAGLQKQEFFEDKDLKKKGFTYGKIYTYENRRPCQACPV